MLNEIDWEALPEGSFYDESGRVLHTKDVVKKGKNKGNFSAQHITYQDDGTVVLQNSDGFWSITTKNPWAHKNSNEENHIALLRNNLYNLSK